jgi:hypothetical protein
MFKESLSRRIVRLVIIRNGQTKEQKTYRKTHRETTLVISVNIFAVISIADTVTV